MMPAAFDPSGTSPPAHGFDGTDIEFQEFLAKLNPKLLDPVVVSLGPRIDLKEKCRLVHPAPSKLDGCDSELFKTVGSTCQRERTWNAQQAGARPKSISLRRGASGGALKS